MCVFVCVFFQYACVHPLAIEVSHVAVRRCCSGRSCSSWCPLVPLRTKPPATAGRNARKRAGRRTRSARLELVLTLGKCLWFYVRTSCLSNLCRKKKRKGKSKKRKSDKKSKRSSRDRDDDSSSSSSDVEEEEEDMASHPILGRQLNSLFRV